MDRRVARAHSSNSASAFAIEQRSMQPAHHRRLVSVGRCGAPASRADEIACRLQVSAKWQWQHHLAFMASAEAPGAGVAAC